MTIPFGTGKTISINQLLGVDITDVANNNVLQYNSTNAVWDNGGLDLSGQNINVDEIDCRVLRVSETADIVGRLANQGVASFVNDGFIFQNGVSDLGDTLYIDNVNNRIGINNATPQQAIDCDGTVQTTQNNSTNLKMLNSGAGGKFWRVGPESNNTCVFYDNDGTGVFIVHNASSWSSNSDERIKKNITELTDCLTKVNQVRAVKYNFISENDTDEKHIGFIAQDFQNILPEVISIAPQQKNMDFDVLGIAYTETIPLLLGAIKELDSIVQNQQSKIASLETKLNELFNK
jgi:hypothetical protein